MGMGRTTFGRGGEGGGGPPPSEPEPTPIPPQTNPVTKPGQTYQPSAYEQLIKEVTGKYPSLFTEDAVKSKEERLIESLMMVGGITLATPLPGDEIIYGIGLGLAALGGSIVLEASKNKDPRWNAPGMPGWRIKQYEQSQPGAFQEPPKFGKGDGWKKILWMLGRLAEAFHKD